MHVANYFLQGDITNNGLPQWLSEVGGFGGSGNLDYGKIVVWINSAGGDVLAAIEAINLIKSSPIPVTTIINGCAESAALLIACAGHHRKAFKNAWGMAHHFSTAMEGNYHELKNSLYHNELLHTTMKDIFVENSNLSSEKVEEMLLGKGSRWMSAEELLYFGLIDEIIVPDVKLRSRVVSNEKKIEVKEQSRGEGYPAARH